METIGRSSSKDRVPFKAAIRKRGRSYKKLITQSVHAVHDNDDLLIEILLRLPVISLFQLKYVCKRWFSLISNPTFTLRRSQIPTLDPPCGLLIKPLLCSGYFLSFNTRSPCKRSALKNPFSFGFCKLHDAIILQSCNGLLLILSKATASNYMYCVYNPCINLIKTLPQCSIKTVTYSAFDTRIAFDPRKSPHYKVIQAVYVLGADDGIYRNKLKLDIQIETYSSETNMWSVCSSRYPLDPFIGFSDGIYWNDAIYWRNKQHNHDPLLIELDISVEHHTLATIETPRTLDGNVSDFKLFETGGCLLLLCRKDDNPLLMDVYEMKKGYAEWLVKYRVNLNDDVSCPRRSWKDPIIYNIVLGEREEDLLIILKDSTKIFQYKPVLETSEDLDDLKSLGSFDCFQFIASFAGAGL